MFYGATVWDPALIIGQIVALQCIFYISLGLWHALLLGKLFLSASGVVVRGRESRGFLQQRVPLPPSPRPV